MNYMTLGHEDSKPFEVDTNETYGVYGDHLVDYEKNCRQHIQWDTVQLRCHRVGPLSALEGALAHCSYAPLIQAILIVAMTEAVRGSQTAQ